MEYFFSILGFLLLILSGKYLVKGSISLARFFKVSTLMIGVTVVAFGTSAPELLVSIQAAINGHPEMAIGNVVGSNISNIALVLGLTAVILPLPVGRNSLRFDWPIMMVVSALLYFLVRNGLLTRLEGIILNVLLIFFILFQIKISGKNVNHETKSKGEHVMKPVFSIFMVVISCAGLVLGADLLVDNASVIATGLGVSERAISISMIAVGTSLPELVTSVMAAVEKQMDISVGNIIGSNIFNILSVLGITALIRPMEVSQALINFDIVWMLGISLLFFILVFYKKKPVLSRFNGLILLFTYVSYIYLVFSL